MSSKLEIYLHKDFVLRSDKIDYCVTQQSRDYIGPQENKNIFLTCLLSRKRKHPNNLFAILNFKDNNMYIYVNCIINENLF